MNIRNFCIIAHIDHGKSTLADRMLEITGTVPISKMREQYLDQMDLERERGITIKMQPVTMKYQFRGEEYMLNLIDTPGHVDFHYEVSRSLKAVEGAILLVDATQGVQAQTLANIKLAKQESLTIIPVINKIDHPAADIEKTTKEIVSLLQIDPGEIITTSAKTGENLPKVIEAVITRIKAPKQDYNSPFQALIFDSIFDSFRGAIAYVRVFSGELKGGQSINMRAENNPAKCLEVGIFHPEKITKESLKSGEIGYVITNLKNVSDCRVGDTINLDDQPTDALAGFQKVKPNVYASFFPSESNDFEELATALEKLKLNDASLLYQREYSSAFKSGFLIGFLGLLHLEIIKERLAREYQLDLIVTEPTVAFKFRDGNNWQTTRSVAEFPEPGSFEEVQEPHCLLNVITPNNCIGPIMDNLKGRHGEYLALEYLDSDLVLLKYDVPLKNIIIDFYDDLKSISAGYASMDYQISDYQSASLVKLEVCLAGKDFPAFAKIVDHDISETVANKMAIKLKKLLPKQQFEIAIQIKVGGKVLARQTLSALRKDVTAKLYGGDRTRKDKLLKKQKKGKARLKKLGNLHIPSSVFTKMIR